MDNIETFEPRIAGLLTDGGKFGKQPSDVLLLTAQDRSACLTITTHESQQWVLQPGRCQLVYLTWGSARVTGGAVACRRLSRVIFARLLAFLDEACAITRNKRMTHDSVCLPISPAAFDGKRGLEYWMWQQVRQNPSPFTPFLMLLRQTEAYWLVRYLLQQSYANVNITAMGEKYGLSYSHFRRVCREVLGSSVKTVLKNWRVARALLDRVDCRTSFTDLALKYGYASSSHFSTEIKGVLGVSPRALSDVTKLL